MKKLMFFLAVIAATSLVFVSCDKSKDDPLDSPIAGDWITPTSADYYNIVFTPQYGYTIQNPSGDIETGDYLVNRKMQKVTLIPDYDGAQTRTLSYVVKGDNLTLTGVVDIKSGASITLNLSRQ